MRNFGVTQKRDGILGPVASRRSESVAAAISGRRAFVRELISFAYAVLLTGSTLFVLALIFGLFLIAGNQGMPK